MRRLAWLVVTIVTIVLFSSMPMQAGVAPDLEVTNFPNTAPLPCAAGNNVPTGGANVRLRVSYIATQFTSANRNKIRELDSGLINFAECIPGAAVVNSLVNTGDGAVPLRKGLCAACRGTNAQCLGFGNPWACCNGAGLGLCPEGSAVPAACDVAATDFTCQDNALGVVVDNDGAGVVAGVPGVRVTPRPNGQTRLIGMVRFTDNGVQDIQVDLNTDLQVKITPRGNDGNVDFHVELAAGGGPTFTVNTTSKKAAQIHREIADGFKGIGYPVVAFGDLSQRSQYPDMFAGSSVRVSNIRTLSGNPVQRVSVRSQQRMEITVEDSEPIPNVPAVSEWTVALFIGLLLLMGTWLLRRRLTTQAI